MSSIVEATGLGLFLYRPVVWCFLRGMKYLSILMVGVALLVSGCVQLEKPPITSVTKLGVPREISIKDSEFREGVFYAKGETEPFTGTAIFNRGDGSRTETPFVNGKMHGTQIWYFKDGSTKTSEFVHGTGTVISYYEDGSKKWETPYANGKMHGRRIEYNQDGSKKYESTLVNGKQHGTVIHYREDGSTHSEIPYVDGKRHGTAIVYNEDGSKKFEAVFENDKMISEKKF